MFVIIPHIVTPQVVFTAGSRGLQKQRFIVCIPI